MHDIQSLPDNRKFPIDQVGIMGLRYPIIVLEKTKKLQQTVATISLAVGLPHNEKGTHMSRFIEVLSEHHEKLAMKRLPRLLRDLKSSLKAASARIEIRFPYFMRRKAPVSGATAPMDYDCWFIGEVDGAADDFILGVKVPVTSLCPCSKAISKHGAHNQRGLVTIEVRGTRGKSGDPAFIWIEDLVKVAEESGSCPVFPLLKRPDEKWVTEHAYENPVFVEDMVRNVAVRLQANRKVDWFRVEAENLESIHNHSAFARLAWQRTARD